jgi:hypothetical protein
MATSVKIALLGRVVWWTITDVSEELTASTIRAMSLYDGGSKLP